jgi:hypothetical protein
MKTVLIVSIAGFIISLIAMVFILASDFGCQQGNVGSAGKIGQIGQIGDLGNESSLLFSSGPDLNSRKLIKGYTQKPQFPANLLLENKQNFAISSWIFSVIPSKDSGLVTVEFQVFNKDVAVPFVGPSKPFIQFSGLGRTGSRTEISIDFYFWRIDELNLALVAPEQSDIIVVGLPIDAVISMNVLVDRNDTAYTRMTSLVVYGKTATDEPFCVPSNL